MECNKKIKILFFIEKLTFGGAEKVLCNLVNHMDQTRFDITVQTVWPCDTKKFLAPGIRYRAMFSSVDKVNQLRYRAEAASGLAYLLHVKDDYDIECAYLEMGSTKIMSASTNRKAKKLAWVHCDLQKIVSNPRAFAEKVAPWYRKFDQVICVSPGVKASFDELLGECCQSQVLFNVIDDYEIRNKANQALPGSLVHRKMTLISVGRFSKPKNYLRLLRAHERLLRDGIDHDLWLVGDGEERPLLERFIQEHQLQKSVFLPGFLDNPYPCIRKADIAVCSSSYEGYSTFLTESVILGKPIVTTAVFGTKELLGESEYGLITENEDESFTSGMKKMLLEEELRKYYADQAVKRSKMFSAERLTAKTEEFFAEMVAK